MIAALPTLMSTQCKTLGKWQRCVSSAKTPWGVQGVSLVKPVHSGFFWASMSPEKSGDNWRYKIKSLAKFGRWSGPALSDLSVV